MSPFCSQGLCCCLWFLFPHGPCRFPRSGLLPHAMLVSTGYASTGAMSIWVAFTTAWGHGGIQVQATAEGMSGSVVLLHPRSVLKFMTYVTTKDQENAWVLGPNLWSFWSLRTMLLSGHYKSEWPVLWLGTMVSSRPLPRPVSGWVVLMHPGSILKWSMAHVTTEGCVSASAQVSHLSTCWWLRAML